MKFRIPELPIFAETMHTTSKPSEAKMPAVYRIEKIVKELGIDATRVLNRCMTLGLSVYSHQAQSTENPLGELPLELLQEALRKGTANIPNPRLTWIWKIETFFIKLDEVDRLIESFRPVINTTTNVHRVKNTLQTIHGDNKTPTSKGAKILEAAIEFLKGELKGSLVWKKSGPCIKTIANELKDNNEEYDSLKGFEMPELKRIKNILGRFSSRLPDRAKK